MSGTPSNQYFVTAFYKFFKLADLPKAKAELEAKATELQIKGLIILSAEGLNGTCAAPSEVNLSSWKQFIVSHFHLESIFFKDSESEIAPFRRFKVKIRSEIVTAGIPDFTPSETKNGHLTPKEWHEVLENEKDLVLIDTRNWYEYKIGTFKGALNPNIEKFTDFPDYIEAQGITKEKKMLIFCTGGIRCEKGILDLQRSGYNNIYQLDGGILNYIKEYPNQKFDGECFVFDHRVALDQNLKPSEKYGLCPHCGQPSEIEICCARCDTQALICSDCNELDFKKQTCSKNCAYQFKMHPDRKGPPQNH